MDHSNIHNSDCSSDDHNVYSLDAPCNCKSRPSPLSGCTCASSGDPPTIKYRRRLVTVDVGLSRPPGARRRRKRQGRLDWFVPEDWVLACAVDVSSAASKRPWSIDPVSVRCPPPPPEFPAVHCHGWRPNALLPCFKAHHPSACKSQGTPIVSRSISKPPAQYWSLEGPRKGGGGTSQWRKVCVV